ncbi:MAG: hypothetical protein ACK50I_09730, partial [Burkholderiales bacterium]
MQGARRAACRDARCLQRLTSAAPMHGLAPYAADPTRSPGRLHPESAPEGRNEFQRDRDRIVHSTAF